MFLGTLAFVALAIPAILLSLAAHYLTETPVSPFVIAVLLDVHYFLLIIDTGMFIAYILGSVWDALPELRRYVMGR